MSISSYLITGKKWNDTHPTQTQKENTELNSHNYFNRDFNA